MTSNQDDQVVEASAIMLHEQLYRVLGNGVDWQALSAFQKDYYRGLSKICFQDTCRAAGYKITKDEGWQDISTAPDFEVVLVQHYEDIYPTAAYKMPDPEAGWFYQQDGPEDIIEDGDHSHKPLKRNPTHWQKFGFGPENPNFKEGTG